MIEKRCLRCKFNKPLSDFSVDARTKDGHQKWCKECWSEYHHNKLSKKRKDIDTIKKTAKLTALIEETAKQDGDMISAHQALNGIEYRSNATTSLNKFLADVASDDTLSNVAKKVTQSNLFKSFVDKYLSLCYDSNNPQYMRDAIMTMGKLAGDLVDKREVTNISQDDANNAFESKMSEVLDRIDNKSH